MWLDTDKHVVQQDSREEILVMSVWDPMFLLQPANNILGQRKCYSSAYIMQRNLRKFRLVVAYKFIQDSLFLTPCGELKSR